MTTPTAPTTPRMTQLQIYKKLIEEKCPPQTESEKVLASIVLVMAEHIEALEGLIKRNRVQGIETMKSVGALARIVRSMRGDETEEAGEGEVEAQGTEAATEEAPTQMKDQTPFPAGAPVSAAPGAGQRVTVQTPEAPAPAPAVQTEEGSLEPNVSSGPAVNAAPIPNASAKKPPQKNMNGAKAEA